MLSKNRPYPGYPQPLFATPSSVIVLSDPPCIEHPQSFMRLLVEIGFYLLIIIELFSAQLGLSGIKLLVGGTVAAGGLFCFFAYLYSNEQLPASFFFILCINFIANFSLVVGNGDMPLLGDGLTELFHWITYALILTFLTRNQFADKRVIFFMALMILLAVVVGGVDTFHYGRPRLELIDVGGNFKNSNDLAYFAGLIAVALLFKAVHAKPLVAVLFCFAAAGLILVCAKTVSRGGILALLFGIVMFLSTILFSGSKLKTCLTVTAFIGTLVGIFLHFTEPLLLLIERFGESSYGQRIGVYQVAPIDDMMGTFIIGMGQSAAVTSGGISAHNSFLHTHIAYGGIASYVYLAWMVWLGAGVWKCWFSDTTAHDIKVFVVTMFLMMIISHVFSNRGYLFLSSIYAAAIIEKYTFPHRLRKFRDNIHAGIT